MLVLSGGELVLFIIANMGLCFGFVHKSVENIEISLLLLSNAYIHQGLFCFSYYPESEGPGVAQEVGRGHSWDTWPQMTKGIFHGIVLSI